MSFGHASRTGMRFAIAVDLHHFFIKMRLIQPTQVGFVTVAPGFQTESDSVQLIKDYFYIVVVYESIYISKKIPTFEFCFWIKMREKADCKD